MTEPKSSLSWKVALAYGLPNFGLAIMVGPVLGIIQGFYAKNYGMLLTDIAAVLFIGRMFDAVSDPAVGIASDKLRHRFWGRRSWLVAGAVISLLAVYKLFIVPADLTPAYFRLWMLVGFLGWTVAEIPYLAWGTEIATEYNDRAKVFSFKTAMGFVGALLFLALPNIIAEWQIRFQGRAADSVTRDYSPLSMQVAFWLLAALMPVFVLISLAACPDGAHVKHPERKGIRASARTLISSKAMLIFTSGFILLGLAGGMQVAMAYLHVSVYLGLAQEVSQIYVIGFLCSLLGVPVWNWVATHTGKHIAFIIGLSLTSILFIGLGLMDPYQGGDLILGRKPVFWYYLLTFAGLNFCQVVYSSMPPAIIGDIADESMLKTREDQSATYYSVYTFLYKSVLGIGTGLAMYISGAVFGFDATAKIQNAKAVLGIKVMMGYLPAALVVAAVVVLLFYPITKARYAQIQGKMKELGLKTS